MEWFNQVDATYKSDVRELNEANMARIDRRFAAQDARIEQLFAAQDTRIDRRFAELEVKWEARFAALEIRIAHAQREQMRFLYLAFAAQMAVLMGIMLR